MNPSSRERALSRSLLAVLTQFGEFLKRNGLLYIMAGIEPVRKDTEAATATAAARGGAIVAKLTETRWARVSKDFGFRPHGLAELVAEEKNAWVRTMRNARDLSSKVIGGFVVTPEVEESWKTYRVARRRMDGLRKMTLDSLFKAYKKESPVAKGSQILQRQLRQFTTDGISLPVRLKPNNALGALYKVYDVRDYAEMAALTTVSEAQTKANFAAAEDVGTELMIYPKFGVNYGEKGDHVCGRINGKIFSLNPNGSTDADGNSYPYIFGPKGLNKSGGYLLPHPRCRHIPSPISEVAAAAKTRRTG